MKKVLSYLGWILFVVTLIAMFWFAKPSDTVDFSGVVKSIEYNEQHIPLPLLLITDKKSYIPFAITS